MRNILSKKEIIQHAMECPSADSILGTLPGFLAHLKISKVNNIVI